jgi:hypothetical protein
MSDGITLHCPRCGEYSALKKEYDNYNGIDVYTCQKKDCGRKFAIELVISNKQELLKEVQDNSPSQQTSVVNREIVHTKKISNVGEIPTLDTKSQQKSPRDCDVQRNGVTNNMVTELSSHSADTIANTFIDTEKTYKKIQGENNVNR